MASIPCTILVLNLYSERPHSSQVELPFETYPGPHIKDNVSLMIIDIIKLIVKKQVE